MTTLTTNDSFAHVALQRSEGVLALEGMSAAEVAARAQHANAGAAKAGARA